MGLFLLTFKEVILMFRKRQLEEWITDSVSMLITFAAGVMCTLLLMGEPEPAQIVVTEYPPLVTGAVFEEEIQPQEIDLGFDILSDSGYETEDLVRMLSDDAHSGLLPYVDAIKKAEEEYGVNALYLTCKLGLESGWGKYETGTYNIAGWMNNDGTWRNFSSPEDCVMTVARNLATTYKDTVGTSLGAVCSRYSTNPEYSYVLMDIMEEMQYGYQML